MNQTTRERIRRVIAATFAVPVADVPENAAAGALSSWNSLGQLELMLALETEFGVQIRSDAMIDLLSIDAIEQYLQTQSPA